MLLVERYFKMRKVLCLWQENHMKKISRNLAILSRVEQDDGSTTLVDWNKNENSSDQWLNNAAK